MSKPASASRVSDRGRTGHGLVTEFDAKASGAVFDTDRVKRGAAHLRAAVFRHSRCHWSGRDRIACDAVDWIAKDVAHLRDHSRATGG